MTSHFSKKRPRFRLDDPNPPTRSHDRDRRTEGGVSLDGEPIEALVKRAKDSLFEARKAIDALAQHRDSEAKELVSQLEYEEEAFLRVTIQAWFENCFVCRQHHAAPSALLARDATAKQSEDDSDGADRDDAEPSPDGSSRYRTTHNSPSGWTLMTRGRLRNSMNEYLQRVGLPTIDKRHHLWTQWFLGDYLRMSACARTSGKAIHVRDFRTPSNFEKALEETLEIVRQRKQVGSSI